MSQKREKLRRYKERLYGGYNGKMERAMKEWRAAEPPKWMLLSYLLWKRRDPRRRRRHE